MGSSKVDLIAFPKDVKSDVGHALREAQEGKKSASAKPLKGYKGAGVLEIVDRFDKDTYRAVYTIKFKEAVYVLHCFQKKSTKGIETPKKEIDLIDKRLKAAAIDYENNYTKR